MPIKVKAQLEQPVHVLARVAAFMEGAERQLKEEPQFGEGTGLWLTLPVAWTKPVGILNIGIEEGGVIVLNAAEVERICTLLLKVGRA
jgi:hypothetical protein